MLLPGLEVLLEETPMCTSVQQQDLQKLQLSLQEHQASQQELQELRQGSLDL